ncbi:hypothetical protein [Rhodanobacter lindaniclasticus]
MAACKAQFDRLFARYFTPASGHERTELMVCHGNVIRNMVVRALGVDPQAWLEMSVGNAEHHADTGRGGWHVQGDLRRRRRPSRTCAPAPAVMPNAASRRSIT